VFGDRRPVGRSVPGLGVCERRAAVGDGEETVPLCNRGTPGPNRGVRKLEPDRAGSRHRCSLFPPAAVSCRAGDVSRRHFLRFCPFANVGVAGSRPRFARLAQSGRSPPASPASCSRKSERPRSVRPGAFSCSVGGDYQGIGAPSHHGSSRSPAAHRSTAAAPTLRRGSRSARGYRRRCPRMLRG